MDKYKPASLDAEIERYSQQMLRDYSKAFAAQAAAPVSAAKKEPIFTPIAVFSEKIPDTVPVPVAEPVADEPMAAEPMAAKPMAAEPMAAKPMAAKPIAAKPMVAEPMAAKPMAAKPIAAKPMAAEPMAITPTSIAPPVTVSPAKPVVSAPPEPPKRPLTPEEENKKYEAEHPEHGAIRTQVLTARGAYPVPNTTVTISKVFESGEYIISTQTTDAAGLTEPVLLHAPNEALSEAPDPSSKPYAEYKVTFTHPSFATIVSKNVPVFSGITATQTVNMVPLAAMPKGKTIIEYNNIEPRGL